MSETTLFTNLEGVHQKCDSSLDYFLEPGKYPVSAYHWMKSLKPTSIDHTVLNLPERLKRLQNSET